MNSCLHSDISTIVPMSEQKKPPSVKRDDVLFKIFLRSIKRFYCEASCDNNKFFNCKTKEEELNFMRRIDDQCSKRFSNFFTREQIETTPSLVEVANPDFDYKPMYLNTYFRVKALVACICTKYMMKKYFTKC